MQLTRNQPNSEVGSDRWQTWISPPVLSYIVQRCWVKVRSPHFEGIYFWMLDIRWKLTWMSQDQSREYDEYCKHFKVLHDYTVIWICCEIESCLWWADSMLRCDKKLVFEMVLFFPHLFATCFLVWMVLSAPKHPILSHPFYQDGKDEFLEAGNEILPGVLRGTTTITLTLPK